MAEFISSTLRSHIQTVRKDISWRNQKTWSNKIIRKILQLDAFRKAKNIAIYMAISGEVSLRGLWDSTSLHGKYFYFPVLSGEHLDFYHATPHSSFIENKFGILEPEQRADKISLSKLDLVLVPLVSFDIEGNRLGMGKGYYDKTFKHLKDDENRATKLIGVAYEFQQYTPLEPNEWDVRLDAIITEETLYRVSL